MGTMGNVWGLCRRRCSYWRWSSLTWLLRRTTMTHRVSKRDIVLFVIAQVVSISLLVLFFSQLLHNLSSVFQLVYIVAALLVVVVDILLIRKIMTRREEPTVLNQIKASLACFLLLTLSCLRFLTTDFYYQKVIAIFVGFFSLLGFVLFLWGIKYINHNIEK